MDMIKAGGLGLVAVLLALQLKEIKSSYAVYLILGAGLVLSCWIVGRMGVIVGMLEKIESYIPVDTSYLAVVLKMLGITFLADLCAALCKDGGYGSVAGQIQMFAKLTILSMSMPILLALVETIGDLV